MSKKILGIMIALILLFIPQTVFADFASCVLISGNNTIYIDVTEEDQLDVRIYNNHDVREYTFDITKEEKTKVIDFLEPYIYDYERTEDTNIINDFFNNVKEIGYLYGGYRNSEMIFAYSYDRVLLDEIELEKGYITELINKKIAEENGVLPEVPEETTTDSSLYDDVQINNNLTLEDGTIAIDPEDIDSFKEAIKEFVPEMGGMIVTMLLTSCLIPVIFIIVFIKILKAAAKVSTKIEKRTTRTRKDDEFFEQAVKEFEKKEETPVRYRPNKKKREPWSNDNNDDPFSIK